MSRETKGKVLVCPFPECGFKALTMNDLSTHLNEYHKEELIPTKPTKPVRKAPIKKVIKKVERALKELGEERERELPPSWKPTQVGEIISGKIVDIRTVTVFNQDRTLIELEDSQGKRTAVWLTTAVLKRLVDEDLIKIGYYIAIRWLGRPKGRRWFDYNWVISDEKGNIIAAR